jgi:hypothetical protein
MDLTAIATRLGIEMPLTRMYQAGLRSSGALVPTEQAVPITLDQLQRLKVAARDDRLGRALSCALFLTWKTASRWDDISRLRGRQFVKITPEEIVIVWADNTKATRSDPFRADSQISLRHHPCIPEEFITTLRALRPDDDLCQRSTQWFTAWLKKVLPESNASAHSIKSAAIGFLATAVDEGKLTANLLPIVAKHKVQGALPTTTLRYIRDPVVKAHIIGTGQATILLPW